MKWYNRITLFFFVHCVHVDINEGSFVYKEGNILQRILLIFGLNRTFLKTHQLLKIRIVTDTDGGQWMR